MKGFRFGIVVAEWNSDITEALFQDAAATLRKAHVHTSSIERINVPGTFELPFGAALLAKKKNIDVIIAIGCVIKGDTPHFDYICSSVSQSLQDVSLQYLKPVVFAVLTTLTKKQAKERTNGKHSRKGVEAAITAIRMAGLARNAKS